VQARVRDFTQVMPAATEALTAATYSIAHAPFALYAHHPTMHNRRFAWKRR
jgi:hypothetical protein